MHHYTECGLDNVWLESGYRLHKTAYGNAISIDLADSLHSAIAFVLSGKAGQITGKELRFLRVFLSMSPIDFGSVVGSADQSVSLWERTGKVPHSADIIIRMLILERIGMQTSFSRIIELVSRSGSKSPAGRLGFKLTRAKWRVAESSPTEVDLQVFRSEVTATKESAVVFLKRAGLVTAAGRSKQLIRNTV